MKRFNPERCTQLPLPEQLCVVMALHEFGLYMVDKPTSEEPWHDGSHKDETLANYPDWGGAFHAADEPYDCARPPTSPPS